jgi:hypothetical protein
MHVLSRGGREYRANGKCNANLAIYLQGAPPHVHWVSRYVAFFNLGSMSSDIGKHNVHWVVMNGHHTSVYYIDIPFSIFFGVLRCVGTHLMWSLFLIWMAYDMTCSWKWTSRWHVLQQDWIVFSYTNTIVFVMVNVSGRASRITWRGRDSPLWPLLTCTSQLQFWWTLKQQCLWFAIDNNRNCLWSWKCPH